MAAEAVDVDPGNGDAIMRDGSAALQTDDGRMDVVDGPGTKVHAHGVRDPGLQVDEQ